MFLAGGFSRLAINAKADGNMGSASSYGAAAASMIFIFTSTFGATWLTVPWLYPAEIFPLAVRARGNAWGVVGWSIGNGWLVSNLTCSLHKRSKYGDTNINLSRLCSAQSCSILSAKRPSTSSQPAT